MEGRYVSYLRVSTWQQGHSGLGLEAQRKTVTDFLNGGSWTLLQEFVEVETGKGRDALERRPVLNEAIALCKKKKATLLIAKLDRLSRSVSFTSTLMDSGVKFVCCDMPEANSLVIHIMAAMAQYEAERIGQRTKEALAQAKARGVRLGNPNWHIDISKRIEKADAFARDVEGTIRAHLNNGLTQREIVEELNRSGAKTPKGGRWHLVTLQRTMKRLGLRGRA